MSDEYHVRFPVDLGRGVTEEFVYYPGRKLLQVDWKDATNGRGDVLNITAESTKGGYLMSNVWGKQRNKGLGQGHVHQPRTHGKAVHTPTLLVEGEDGKLKPYKRDQSQLVQPVEEQKATIISSITGQ